MDYKKAGVDIEAGYKSVELMKKYVSEKILDNGNRQAIFYFDKDYNLTDKDNAYYVRIEEYNSKNYLIKCDVEELFNNE